jgi:PAS domain S-box-containing protein
MSVLQEASAAGTLARRALVVVFALPVLAGYLTVRGHTAGLYDASMQSALMVLALVSTLCVLLWWAVSVVRRREQSLVQSEHRFSSFMEYLPGLAWIKDVDGRYLYANEAATRAFGMTRSALYGKTDLDIFPAEIAAQFRGNDLQAVTSGAGVQVIETLQHPDNSVHHSLVSKFPIAAGERALLIGGMAIDITDRKRAEESLRDADRRKDEFLATLAHELRNPLAPIRTGLEIIKRSPLMENPALAEIQQAMERQMRHLVRLVDDLLDLSRISRDKLELRKQPTQLPTILRQAVEICQPLADKQRQQIELRLPASEIHLQADPIRLAQVFSNLLNNACKYSPAESSILISAEQTGASAMVRVKDNGIGIPPDKLGEVFDMFTQVHQPLERSQSGLGIGLTLVRRLVLMHGGSVTATSAGPGQGSEFIVRLPIDVDASHHAPAPHAAAAAAIGK